MNFIFKMSHLIPQYFLDLSEKEKKNDFHIMSMASLTDLIDTTRVMSFK